MRQWTCTGWIAAHSPSAMLPKRPLPMISLALSVLLGGWFLYSGGEKVFGTGLTPFLEGSVEIENFTALLPVSKTFSPENIREAQALGLTVGNTYPLAVFHAERHTRGSNFRIETTIDCIQDVPPR